MPSENDAITFRENCRACGGISFSLYLDLGLSPLANSFVRKEDLDKPEAKYPLRVYLCNDCSFSQLRDIVRPEILFRDYIYFSSGVRSVPEYFKQYAREITEKFVTEPATDLVVELGSNDGVLLRAIKELGVVNVLGIDPAVNIAKIANEQGIPTLAEFFNEEVAKRVRAEHGAAKVMLGNNVFAHIDDLPSVVRGASALLADDGVFIFESPYLKDMFDNLSFDTVYHEHVSYLSVRPLVKMFKKAGLEVFQVKTFPVQGVSLRTYVGRPGAHPIDPSVAQFIAEEERIGMDKVETYHQLAKSVAELKERTVSLLRELKKDGKKLAAYGAPAKGNTLLNYFGIGPDLLDHATEELPSKVGLYTPGMHIPVIHVADSRKAPPDYYLLLTWNTPRDVIMRNEKTFLENGGKFIVPIGYKTEIIG